MTSALDRVRRYYLERDRGGLEAANTLREKPHRYTMQSLERALLDVLTREGLDDLSGATLLDVGCGTGHWLTRFALYGAEPTHMTGIDLLQGRAALAARRHPAATIVSADAQRLPFVAEQFDLVAQFVLLSSILEDVARVRIAREMLRVLRPGGAVVAYDFIWNPRNANTRGLRQRDYRRLFPGCDIRFTRVTLAPPIARRLAGLSFIACQVLEKVVFLRSHYIVVVRKR